MDTRALWFVVLLGGAVPAASPIFGQDAGPPELLWFTRLGGPVTDLATSVKEVNGDGFIVTGLTQTRASIDREDYLLRISPDGELLWKAPFGDGNGDEYFYVDVAEDGFFVAGWSWSCGDADSCVFLLKMGLDGTVRWEKRIPNRFFPVSRSGRVVDVKVTRDGGAAFVGETIVDGVTKVFAGKVDSEGDLEWESLLDEGPSVEVDACCIEPTTEGGYIVGGISERSFLLTKLTGNGGTLWQRAYAGPTRGSSVQELAGGFTFSGGTNGTGYAFRTDADGEVLWRRELEIVGPDFIARRLADGQYAVVASAGPLPSLLKMDEAGGIVWEKVFGEHDTTYVGSFEVTRDGGYVAAGFRYLDRDFDLFIARLAPTGVGRFIRGDSNDDGQVNLADAVFSLTRLFGGAREESDCLQAADADDDGEVNLTDPVFVLQYLFRAGPRPPAPFDRCGIDKTVDGLGCAGARSCRV